MSTENISNLINDLSEDLKATKRLAHPLLRTMPWAALSLAYIGVMVYFIGLRPDIARKFHDTYFLYEITITGFISLSAVLASAWLSVPDMRGAKWLPAVPLSALGAFVAWTVARGMNEPVIIPEPHWDHCFNDGLIMGFVPAAAMIFLVRGGATTRPFMSALMNSLAVGGLGYLGLRFTCMMDNIGHAFFYHLVPFVAVGILAGLFARKLYEW